MCRSEHSTRMLTHIPLSRRITMMRRRRNRLPADVRKRLDRLDKCQVAESQAKRDISEFKKEHKDILKRLRHLHRDHAKKLCKLGDMREVFRDVCVPQVPLMEEDEEEEEWESEDEE